ncbi:MAG: tetratricopeptide repeat protein [Pyrinomonadaceae bacterium]
MRQQIPMCLAAVALAIALPFLCSSSAMAQNFNRIEGTVVNESNQPVSDLYIELADEANGDLGRTRTTGSGRFSFGGLSTGRFVLTVVTSGTNYLSDTKDVEIRGTGVRTSTDIAYVDFRLKLDPRRITVGSGGPAEAIFVQAVPESAKKLYSKGVPDIKTDKGLKLVEDSISAYSDYFDALSAAGREYVDRGNYAKGAVYLVRAVRVNERSYTAYSSLAYAAYKLNKIPEATEAARLAVTIEPKAIGTRVMLGRLLRLGNELKLAEGILLDTVKMAANNPQTHYELALVYNRENRNSDAASELEQYLKLAPNDPDKRSVEDLIAKLRAPATSKFEN